jgi:hypothetical protein
MTEKVKMYTMVDFARIQRAGFNYTLPQETVDIVQKLASLVGAEMPMITKPTRPEKQGQDKLLADIKSDLNKLSDDTFDEIAPCLVANIRKLAPYDGASLIMETATNNKFYAGLYAKILVQCNDSDLLAQRTTDHVARVLCGDAACRAFTSFLKHLALEKVVGEETMACMATSFQDKLESGMGDVGARTMNEELSEHVMELVAWLPMERVFEMTKRLPKDFPGITFKVYFKYLDYHEKHSEKKSLVKVK